MSDPTNNNGNGRRNIGIHTIKGHQTLSSAPLRINNTKPTVAAKPVHTMSVANKACGNGRRNGCHYVFASAPQINSTYVIDN